MERAERQACGCMWNTGRHRGSALPSAIRRFRVFLSMFVFIIILSSRRSVGAAAVGARGRISRRLARLDKESSSVLPSVGKKKKEEKNRSSFVDFLLLKRVPALESSSSFSSLPLKPVPSSRARQPSATAVPSSLQVNPTNKQEKVEGKLIFSQLNGSSGSTPQPSPLTSRSTYVITFFDLGLKNLSI